MTPKDEAAFKNWFNACIAYDSMPYHVESFDLGYDYFSNEQNVKATINCMWRDFCLYTGYHVPFASFTHMFIKWVNKRRYRKITQTVRLEIGLALKKTRKINMYEFDSRMNQQEMLE